MKFDARSNERERRFDVAEDHALESTRKVPLTCLYTLKLAALVAVAWLALNRSQ